MRMSVVGLFAFILGIAFVTLPLPARAQTVAPFLQLCMPVGNGQKLSSNSCLCNGNNDCINVCGGANGNICGGGVAVLGCAPTGNNTKVSANGCSCASNNDCINVCGGATGNICGGGGDPPGPPPVCRAPGSGGDLSVDGCPCDSNNDCVGTCSISTRTCGGVVGAIANIATAISGVASNDVVLGQTIFDQATVSGGRPMPGRMIFRAYGPDDVACAAIDFTSSHALAGMGMSTSNAFLAPAPGTWRWIATYPGNGWNLPAATACSTLVQRVVVLSLSVFSNGFEQ
jgi:hypothetical protein